MQPEENKWLVVREPLQSPAIDPHLEELNVVVRTTECLRHFVLSIEYWLSPNGRLRQWIKINVCVAAWLVIPAVILMPVISLVLYEVDGWLSMLLSIVLKVILLIAVVTVAMFAIKHFPSSSPGSSRKRK